jgi:hypothetical protein
MVSTDVITLATAGVHKRIAVTQREEVPFPCSEADPVSLSLICPFLPVEGAKARSCQRLSAPAH